MTAVYKYRKKLNMTQKELADKIGVCASTIAMWETGARKPDIITLKKLAAVLETTTDALLEPIKI